MTCPTKTVFANVRLVDMALISRAVKSTNAGVVKFLVAVNCHFGNVLTEALASLCPSYLTVVLSVATRIDTWDKWVFHLMGRNSLGIIRLSI